MGIIASPSGDGGYKKKYTDLQNAIYNALVAAGITPASKNTADIVSAINSSVVPARTLTLHVDFKGRPFHDGNNPYPEISGGMAYSYNNKTNVLTETSRADIDTGQSMSNNYSRFTAGVTAAWMS